MGEKKRMAALEVCQWFYLDGAAEPFSSVSVNQVVDALMKARSDALEEAAKLADEEADQIWADGEDAVLKDLARRIRARKDKP